MRDLCNKCKRPKSLCYCKSVNTIYSQTKIILLTHPLEVKHPFNTGRIVELSFEGTQNFIGEDFNNHLELQTIIQNNRCALLFIDLDQNQARNEEATPNFDYLIVLDANWKKAKRMFYLNSFLQNLEKVTLTKDLPSMYQIRKARKNGMYSTIESVVYALNDIDKADYSKALEPYFEMINKQKEFTSKFD